MNCADAQHLIHLDVGGDLRTEDEFHLLDHMEQCSDCRTYRNRMAEAMTALWSLRATPATAEDTDAPRGSVWANVSREISRRRVTLPGTQRFNLRVAALSVCSLSLAVVTIVQSLSSLRESASASRAAEGQQAFSVSQFRQPQGPFQPQLPPQGNIDSEFAPAFPALEDLGAQSF